MRKNVRGIRPSPVKDIKPNIGQETNQPIQSLVVSHRVVMEIGIGPIKAIEQQAVSPIMLLNKRTKYQVILQLANKINKITAMTQRRANQKLRIAATWL